MDAAGKRRLALRIECLAVFSSVAADPAVAALSRALRASAAAEECVFEAAADEAARAYAGFAAALFEAGTASLGSHLCSLVLNDENAYLRIVGAGGRPAPALAEAAECELSLFDELARLVPDDFLGTLGADASWLPRFEAGKACIARAYAERMGEISRYGYGIYASSSAFRIDEAGCIVPVVRPDRQRLCDLVGYEREKRIVLDNTRALLAGLPAANVLLAGDAGTGKSSLVKAVAHDLSDEGLRIVEVRKEQLRAIPALLDELGRNPLSFILFVDDLSFAEDDDDFAALKAILEGSVTAKPANVAIYATSNRRHLVRESFSAREGDDVHLNDTLQEIASLADRFGIRLLFSRPDRATYLAIVHRLAAERGIALSEEELDLLAERDAVRRHGRTARGARHFVDGLVASSR